MELSNIIMLDEDPCRIIMIECIEQKNIYQNVSNSYHLFLFSKKNMFTRNL